MLPFCRWLEQTSVGAGIRESLWLFPAIETLHLLGMAALVGTIAVFDLRLLGWMLRRGAGFGAGWAAASLVLGGICGAGGYRSTAVCVGSGGRYIPIPRFE